MICGPASRSASSRLPDTLSHRQLDHAAEEEPRRRRAGARPCRADRRLPDRADGDDEGPAARLFEGHAGRQAAGVRGGGPARPVDRGDDRDDRRSRLSRPSACCRPPSWAMPPRPTWPTGWCARRISRFARRTTSPARRSSWPRSKGVALDQLSLDELQAIDSRIDERVFKALSVEARSRRAPVHGGTAPDRGAETRRRGARRAWGWTHEARLPCSAVPLLLAACGQKRRSASRGGETPAGRALRQRGTARSQRNCSNSTAGGSRAQRGIATRERRARGRSLRPPARKTGP